MRKQFLHLLVTLLVLLMPMQAISMQMAMNQSNSAESSHHTAMLSEQDSQQSMAMGEHCKMQMHQGKQTQQKSTYCLGSTCSVICAGLVLSMPLFTLATNPAVNDFTAFVAPHFRSQAPDSLERPPRTFS